MLGFESEQTQCNAVKKNQLQYSFQLTMTSIVDKVVLRDCSFTHRDLLEDIDHDEVVKWFTSSVIIHGQCLRVVGDQRTTDIPIICIKRGTLFYQGMIEYEPSVDMSPKWMTPVYDIAYGHVMFTLRHQLKTRNLDDMAHRRPSIHCFECKTDIYLLQITKAVRQAFVRHRMGPRWNPMSGDDFRISSNTCKELDTILKKATDIHGFAGWLHLSDEAQVMMCPNAMALLHHDRFRSSHFDDKLWMSIMARIIAMWKKDNALLAIAIDLYLYRFVGVTSTAVGGINCYAIIYELVHPFRSPSRDHHSVDEHWITAVTSTYDYGFNYFEPYHHAW
jgi:hypothetical protein